MRECGCTSEADATARVSYGVSVSPAVLYLALVAQRATRSALEEAQGSSMPGGAAARLPQELWANIETELRRLCFRQAVHAVVWQLHLCEYAHEDEPQLESYRCEVAARLWDDARPRGLKELVDAGLELVMDGDNWLDGYRRYVCKVCGCHMHGLTCAGLDEMHNVYDRAEPPGSLSYSDFLAPFGLYLDRPSKDCNAGDHPSFIITHLPRPLAETTAMGSSGDEDNPKAYSCVAFDAAAFVPPSAEDLELYERFFRAWPGLFSEVSSMTRGT
ncbi:hypothetical protein JCM10450v2_000398 [Rhodotorula kratochvilovae]